MSNITTDKYVKFAAKKALIENYCQNKPDSLGKYMSWLYKNEGLSPASIKEFIRKTNKNPEQWIEIQQKVVGELEKMDPSKPAIPSVKK